MNFPVGIAVGLAMGVAIGIASGRKSALDAIRSYAQMHNIMARDAAGKIIGWEDLLNEAVQTGDDQRRPMLVALVLLGLIAMIGILVYFWWLGG
jgi:hypothetical protein